MGKDIHIVLERRTNSGWEFFDPGFEAYDLRFSSFFDFLSDAGDPGCPEELKDRQLRPQIYQWRDADGTLHEEKYSLWDTTGKCEMYGFATITLEQLEAAARRRGVMWVSADFLERFQALGGVLPEEMYLDGDAADRDTSAVGIRVADEDEMYLQEYIHAGITELKRIAEKHDLQPQYLRVCFAFD